MMEENILCYICYEHESTRNPYLKEPSPCSCKGSIVIHKKCFENILKTSHVCTICKTKYNSKYLPKRDGLELITEIDNNGDINEYTINANGDYHGEYIIKSQMGAIVFQAYYQYGLLNGLYRIWYYNGKLSEECTCKNNKIHGIYRAWHPTGQIMEYSFYVHGIKEGISKKWNPTGKLKCNYLYNKGEVFQFYNHVS